MNNQTLLPQPGKGGAHFLASVQRFHGQLVDFRPFLADCQTFFGLSWRDNHDSIRIRDDEVAGVDRQRSNLLGRGKLHGNVQSRCSSERV